MISVNNGFDYIYIYIINNGFFHFFCHWGGGLVIIRLSQSSLGINVLSLNSVIGSAREKSDVLGPI